MSTWATRNRKPTPYLQADDPPGPKHYTCASCGTCDTLTFVASYVFSIYKNDEQAGRISRCLACKKQVCLSCAVFCGGSQEEKPCTAFFCPECSENNNILRCSGCGKIACSRCSVGCSGCSETCCELCLQEADCGCRTCESCVDSCDFCETSFCKGHADAGSCCGGHYQSWEAA